MGVCYMPHKTNLVVETLLHLVMVSRFESLLSIVYNYFSKQENPWKVIRLFKTCWNHENEKGQKFEKCEYTN
jgi:hypothetical protein